MHVKMKEIDLGHDAIDMYSVEKLTFFLRA